MEDVTETELNVTHSLPQSQGTGPNFTEKSYTPVFDSNLTIPASDHIEVPDGMYPLDLPGFSMSYIFSVRSTVVLLHFVNDSSKINYLDIAVAN